MTDCEENSIENDPMSDIHDLMKLFQLDAIDNSLDDLTYVDKTSPEKKSIPNINGSFKLYNLNKIKSPFGGFPNADEEIEYKTCPNCNVQMHVKITHEYICETCGLSKENITSYDEYNIASGNSYNTLNNSSTPLKCVGSNSFKFQCLLRNNSSYAVIQDNNIKNTLFGLNYNCTEINIPKNILLSVSEQYKLLIRKSNNIYRGQILRGILASLTYYECLKKKLTHKPKEIAAWINIDSINLSKGIKKLHEEGIIELDLDNIEITKNFIYSYSMRLDIDQIYLPFLYELLDAVDKLKIVNPNSKSSTKAISLLYLLIVCKKIPITQEQLHKEFEISTTTFKSVTNLILKHVEMVSYIFDKHKIPKLSAVPRANKPRKTKKKIEDKLEKRKE